MTHVPVPVKDDNAVLRPVAADQVTMGPGLLSDRFALNVTYMRTLQPINLLRPYLFEAGLWSWCGTAGTTVGATVADGPDTWHWGWEAPTSPLRGHILGHWLSAASSLRHRHADLGAAADEVVRQLDRCQQANGGGWIAPFPPAYLERMAAGRPVWAPHYVLHKLLAGLLDAAVVGGNELALTVLGAAAKWFHTWSGQFDDGTWADILDVETGGMLEVWAALYEVTGEPTHRELMNRYRRGRFFDRLLSGKDVLTNRHANTQIAEILGCAEAYEVTGDPAWREVVEAFWQTAVNDRGTYVTGGGSSGEVWQPAGQQAARLHDVQEHCTVRNMMRLADFLYRWTGDTVYADYWERNLYNGILAQQHPATGMVAYFLPLESGSTKNWGSPTEDFWCCHGTLLQAHTEYIDAAVHIAAGGVRISQYLPGTTHINQASAAWSPPGFSCSIIIETDVRHGVVAGQRHSVEGYHGIQHVHGPAGPVQRPRCAVTRVQIRSSSAAFTVQLRVPDWVAGLPTVTVNGDPVPVNTSGGVLSIEREWSEDVIEVTFGMDVVAHRLPDQPGSVALMSGPIVLAGLVGEERVLAGDADRPATLVRPDRERQHSWWNAHTFRTVGQDRGFRFVPLFEVTDEQYSVYFTVR